VLKVSYAPGEAYSSYTFGPTVRKDTAWIDTFPELSVWINSQTHE